MGLRSSLLAVVLKDLPDDKTVIDQSSPRFDELMGGKIAPGKWGRFETGYGTTCAVTVVGWLLEVGAPADMLNAVAPGGSGFLPGAHFAKLNAGAKTRGWLMTPQRGVLPDFRPGDLYEINHVTSTGVDGSHIGVVISATPSEDGQSLVVVTGDGGQGSRDDQQIKRNVRTFSLSSGAHPVVVSSASGPGWLDRWIRVGGDETDPTVDELPPTAPSAPDDGTGPSPAAYEPTSLLPVLAFAVGGGLLLWAAGKYVQHDIEPEWKRRVAEHETKKARSEGPRP